MEEEQRSGPTLLMKLIIAAVVFGGLGVLAWKMNWLPSKPSAPSTVPTLDGSAGPAIQGTTVVRLAHWTWNTHQSWALASKGKNTAPDSLFAKNNVTVQYLRIEEIPNQIAAFKKFAKAFDKGNANPTEGAHFFTIMGDAGGMVLNEANKAVKDVNSDFSAEIIGASGFSAGEDKFMGPIEWKKNPKSALGGVVAGVPADGDWNIMIFWCAQNGVPFNSNPKTYDPNALNFQPTDGYIQAGEVYNANKPVERKFESDGKDYKGNVVKKGDSGYVAINGAVTWTPVDKSIADGRGGIVDIVSTKEYSNQMPCFIIGLRQWDDKNRDTVKGMLRAIFTASDMIMKSDVALQNGSLAPKSAQDYRWQAAKYVTEIFGSDNTPEFWYQYYKPFKFTDSKGTTLSIGGSQVSNLKRNVEFFGLDGNADTGQIVYNRFAKLAKTYYPDFVDNIYPWDSVFNGTYIRDLTTEDPALASQSSGVQTFQVGTNSSEQVGDITYRLNFESGSASFMAGSENTLGEILTQLAIAANTKVQIHGHTDSSGVPAQNMTLSAARANAVKHWLCVKSPASCPANRIDVIPHGQTDLLVQDRSSDGQFDDDAGAKNRRVVIKIFKQ